MKVAVTGATGFVGSRLVPCLLEAGHSVLVLIRNPQKAKTLFASFGSAVETIAYQPTEAGDWQNALQGCGGVINLAGDPIADSRWTPAKKQSILQSRVLGTQRLVEAIAKVSPQPVLVSASAIGFYGVSETEVFHETSQSGSDFLAEVCQGWETAALAAGNSGSRVAIIRIGIVVGPDGGAISKMLPPFRLFGGGPLGSGEQWFSWIHRDDLVQLLIQALTDDQFQGAYNGTAPEPVRMHQLCTVLGQVINRPSWLPVPEFALELLLGEGAQVVLEGQQVLPTRTLSTGFQFQYPTLDQALRQFLSP
ncbi:MAG: TIGR01777 family oxidoreductase [Prochlorothrix sp.]